jgi:hypothetical protein
VKRSVASRDYGKEEMTRQSMEDFEDRETILYDTIMMDHLSNP